MRMVGIKATQLDLQRCPAEVGHGPVAHQTYEVVGSAKGTENQKIAGIETLRFFACLGIIWFHVKAPGAAIGYGGLPALMAVSVSLAARPNVKRSPWSAVWRRAQRLLVPWLFWSGVYMVLKLACVAVGARHFKWEFGPSIILTGGELHLWYLPFAFVATSVVAALASTHDMSKWTPVWSGACAASLTLCSWCMAHVSLQPPFAQWVFILPAVLLGMAMAGTIRKRGQKAALFVGFVVLCTCAVDWALGWRGLAIPYAVGATVYSFAVLFRRPASRVVATAGALSYGVYILHALAAAICARILHQHSGTALAFLAMAVSIAGTGAARLTKLKRVL